MTVYVSHFSAGHGGRVRRATRTVSGTTSCLAAVLLGWTAATAGDAAGTAAGAVGTEDSNGSSRTVQAGGEAVPAARAGAPAPPAAPAPIAPHALTCGRDPSFSALTEIALSSR